MPGDKYQRTFLTGFSYKSMVTKKQNTELRTMVRFSCLAGLGHKRNAVATICRMHKSTWKQAWRSRKENYGLTCPSITQKASCVNCMGRHIKMHTNDGDEQKRLFSMTSSQLWHRCFHPKLYSGVSPAWPLSRWVDFNSQDSTPMKTAASIHFLPLCASVSSAKRLFSGYK